MVLGGQGAEAHGNLDNPSAGANVGLNYVTISSYHARPSASITLCGPGAVFSPRPTSLHFLLFLELDFSEARCLLATGVGGFLLSGLFQTPIFNAVLIRFIDGGVLLPPAVWAAACLGPGCRPGATIPAGGCGYEKAPKMKVPR